MTRNSPTQPSAAEAKSALTDDQLAEIDGYLARTFSQQTRPRTGADLALRDLRAEVERLQKREAAMLHWVHFAQGVYADNPDFLGALSAIEFVAVPKPLTEAEIKRGQEIEAEITGSAP